MKKVVLKKNGQPILDNCFIATSFFSRFLGLMGKKSLSENFAVYFPRCSSIHTFFVRIPLDVIFVDANKKVIKIIESLQPWKVIPPIKGAKDVFEMKTGEIKRLGFSMGDLIEL